jgi:hypothetical protein
MTSHISKHGSGSESDDEWDFCDDKPISSSQAKLWQRSAVRGKGYVAAVDGHLSGLIEQQIPVRKVQLSAEIDPARIPSDAVYKEQLSLKANNHNHLTIPALSEKIRKVYDPEIAALLPNSLVFAAKNRISSDQKNAFSKELKNGGGSSLPYFFYGSAMFPAIIKQIAAMPGDLRAISSRMTPGLLTGYNRHAVRGAQFPAIVQSGTLDTSVNGMVVFGIKDAARPRIHAFEGGMFQLRKIEVAVEYEEGTLHSIECGVYVWKRNLRDLVPVEEKEWNLMDLMNSEWHLANLKRFESEEKLLATTVEVNPSFLLVRYMTDLVRSSFNYWLIVVACQYYLTLVSKGLLQQWPLITQKRVSLITFSFS